MSQMIQSKGVSAQLVDADFIEHITISGIRIPTFLIGQQNYFPIGKKTIQQAVSTGQEVEHRETCTPLVGKDNGCVEGIGETTITHGIGFVLKENAVINRIQFIFEEKPDEDTRKLLKSKAFRWAPSKCAWQRKLTDNARTAARQIAETLGMSEAAEVDGQTSML